MSDETELRAMFHSDALYRAAPPSTALDAATIIRRSKRRRLPQKLGAGGAMTLAVAGIGVAGITGISGLRGTTTEISETMGINSDQAPMNEAEGQPDATSLTRNSPQDSCGLPTPTAAANPWHLASELTRAQAPSTNGEVALTVVLKNSGADRVTGHLDGPIVLTFSQNDEVVAFGSSNSHDTAIELEPAESVQLERTITPVLCETDAAPPEPGKLTSGEYLVTAEFELIDGDNILATVGSSATRISIR